MDRKLVSVIVPTYNRAHLLPRAINSVLNQIYQNFELIIVNDGSTDDTEKVVKSFRDRRIRYYEHETNRGADEAAYTGYNMAKGDYLASLGDDDELLSEALEITVNKFAELSKQNVNMIFFDCMDFETKKLIGHGLARDGQISREACLCDKFRGDFFIVYDRNLINSKEGRDKNLWRVGGKVWASRLLHKFKAFYVRKTLYLVHREHGRTVSDFRSWYKNLDAVVLKDKIQLRECGKEIKKLCPKVYGRHLMMLGFHQLLIGEKFEGRKTLHESLKFGFFSRAIILFLLSFILNKDQMAVLYGKILDIENWLRKVIRVPKYT